MKLAMHAARSTKHVDSIDEALNLIPVEVIERYRLDFELSPEDALFHTGEFVRYMAMCADRPHADYGMAGQIDEVWHTFILYTRDYAKWCNEVFGRFMHHVPTPPEEKQEVVSGNAVDTYALFYRDYSLFYGGLPPEIWPAPHSQLNDCGGGGCGGGGSSCGSSSCGSSPSSCSTSPSNCSSCSSPSPSSPNPSSPRPRPSSCSSKRPKKSRWPFK